MTATLERAPVCEDVLHANAQWVVLQLDEGGYLNTVFGNVHHKETKVGVYHRPFDTRAEAQECARGAYMDESDTILAYAEDGWVKELWFTEAQKEAGLLDRLRFWKACYGGYKIVIY
jgi:hypothetical protein